MDLDIDKVMLNSGFNAAINLYKTTMYNNLGALGRELAMCTMFQVVVLVVY
jgi:hypothetical protein